MGMQMPYAMYIGLLVAYIHSNKSLMLLQMDMITLMNPHLSLPLLSFQKKWQ